MNMKTAVTLLSFHSEKKQIVFVSRSFRHDRGGAAVAR